MELIREAAQGLAIGRMLAREMRGDLTVESKLGERAFHPYAAQGSKGAGLSAAKHLRS